MPLEDTRLFATPTKSRPTRVYEALEGLATQLSCARVAHAWIEWNHVFDLKGTNAWKFDFAIGLSYKSKILPSSVKNRDHGAAIGFIQNQLSKAESITVRRYRFCIDLSDSRNSNAYDLEIAMRPVIVYLCAVFIHAVGLAPQMLYPLGLFLGLTVIPVDAGIMTFNVDLSGGSNLGNTFRVYGTLTVDPALAISPANTASTLFFQRNDDPILAFITVQTPGNRSLSSLRWEFSSGNLYITRVGTLAESIVWSSATPDIPYANFLLGAGIYNHFLQRATLQGFEIFVLKPSSGPDGPNGFLVGTAVPEPSSALLIVGTVVILSLSRRRQSSVSSSFLNRLVNSHRESTLKCVVLATLGISVVCDFPSRLSADIITNPSFETPTAWVWFAPGESFGDWVVDRSSASSALLVPSFPALRTTDGNQYVLMSGGGILRQDFLLPLQQSYRLDMLFAAQSSLVSSSINVDILLSGTSILGGPRSFIAGGDGVFHGFGFSFSTFESGTYRLKLDATSNGASIDYVQISPISVPEPSSLAAIIAAMAFMLFSVVLSSRKKRWFNFLVIFQVVVFCVYFWKEFDHARV
jgi:hypothetical protein